MSVVRGREATLLDRSAEALGAGARVQLSAVADQVATLAFGG